MSVMQLPFFIADFAFTQLYLGSVVFENSLAAKFSVFSASVGN